jgi:hypothetical protein
MSIMDYLGGGAPGEAPPDMGAGGQPPVDIGMPPEAAPPGGGEESGPVEVLKQALDMVKQAISAEPDEQDKLTLEQATTLIQKVLANNEKLADQAIGAGPGARFLRKAQGGAGPTPGGGLV